MSGRLAENVAQFGRALRRAGLPVGPGALVDAVEAVAAVGPERRDDLYWTLHAVFVRRRDASPVFAALFDRFWRRRGFAEQLLAALSPPAPPRGPSPPPAPGQTRADDALRGPDAPRARPHGRERQEVVALAPSAIDALRTRDFAQMTAAEVAEARRLIARLAMPDDRRPTRRLRPDPCGRSLDMRGTLRRSLRTGGVPVALARRSRGEARPPIVALVDISGSMAGYSRLFLHFLHALAASGRSVHAFTFATRLTNVSRELAGRDPDDALARAAARAPDWEGGTRIAPALRAFNRFWSRRVLGGRAVVLLFTDGLEREAGDDLAFETDRLRRSAGRLVWLNPLLRFDAFEPRAAGIRAMLPRVDDFRPIHDLRSMEALTSALSVRPLANRPSPAASPRPIYEPNGTVRP